MGTYCRGRGVFKNDAFTLLQSHYHEPITRKLKEDEFKRVLYRMVINNPTEKFKKIYESTRLK